MKIDIEKKWRELDIYLNEFRQSVIILYEDTREQKKFIHDFKTYLQTKQKIAYIDFSETSDAKSLALQFIQQYILLFGKTPEYDVMDEDYRLLDFSLKLFSHISNSEEIVFWLDNFTEITNMKEADWLCGALRGTFQHQENIVHVFTATDKNAANEIFADYDKPFFHFAKFISLF